MKNFFVGAVMLLFFYSPSAKADHIPNMPPIEEPYHWNHMPVICASSQAILEKVKALNMTPVEISFGRRGANPDGEIVFAVMMFIGPNNERAVITSIPNSNDACLVYISFDAKGTNQGS